MTDDRPILSFTSHAKRLPLIDEVFASHVANAEACGMRVCLALQEDSVPAMTDYQRSLVRDGKVELLTVGRDHGSNTKWTLCRRKYPDAAMVVVDDDVLYGSEGLARLLAASKQNPGAFVCRCCRLLPEEPKDAPAEFTVDRPWPYAKIVAAGGYGDTTRDLFCNRRMVFPAGAAFPEHSHGCVYPPGFPDTIQIPDPCRFDDDVLVGALASEAGAPLLFAGDCGDPADRPLRLYGLWGDQTGGRPEMSGRTDRAIKAAWPSFAAARQPADGVRVPWETFGPAFVLVNSWTPEKTATIAAELDRVGLRAEQVLDDHTSAAEICRRTGKGASRAGLAHERALELFLSTSSAPCCLIVEDDVRFLRELRLVAAALESAPGDFGALRMDWGFRFRWATRTRAAPPACVEDQIRKGTMWIRYEDGSGDGCTAVSRRCAEGWLRALRSMRSGSSVYDGSDNALCDVCRSLGAPLYVSNPPLCVQAGIGRNFRPRGCALQASPAWYGL